MALLFFGPEKLPEIAQKLGKIFGSLKKNSDAVRREFYNSVYSPAREIQNDVRRELVAAKNLSPAEESGVTKTTDKDGLKDDTKTDSK